MKMQCILPNWSVGMPWVSGIQKTFGQENVEFLPIPDYSKNADAYLYLWCDKVARDSINASPANANNFVVLRRYEFFTGDWGQIVWSKVKHLFFVNDVFRIEFEAAFPEKPVPTSVIYNAVDFDLWGYNPNKKHGKNIAVVGHINQKKNLPLALQILARLPEDYTLHLIGQLQCPETYMYICQIARKIRRQVILHEPQPRSVLNRTLDEMNYLLCTAISEGNPNNVNEAMAKGIKPIIHFWPGADWQYPKDLLFSSVDEAVALISQDSEYKPERYHSWAKEHFSLENLEKLKAAIVEAIRPTIETA